MEKRKSYMNQMLFQSDEFSREVCTRCVYSGRLNIYGLFCDYIGTEKHRRQCKPGECVKAGVFKAKKGVRKETVEKIEARFGRRGA